MKQSKVQDINKKVFLVFSLTFIAMGLVFFLPAGSLNYWQAWTFMGVFFIPAIFVIFYFLKNDREFLERRLKFREKETQEKSIIKIALLFFLIGFLIPGFDYRYGWSNVPFWLVISSDIVVFLAYITVFLCSRKIVMLHG